MASIHQPQPGTMTTNARRLQIEEMRFMDVRNLAYIDYKKSDGSPILTYEQTLNDRDSVKAAVLQFEIASGWLIPDGTENQVAAPVVPQQAAQPSGVQQMNAPFPQQPQPQMQQPAQQQMPFGAQPQQSPQTFGQPQQPFGVPQQQVQMPPQQQMQQPQQAQQPQMPPQQEQPAAAPSGRGRRKNAAAGTAVAPPPAAPPQGAPLAQQTFAAPPGVQAPPTFGAPPQGGVPFAQTPPGQPQFVPNQQPQQFAAPQAQPTFAPQAQQVPPPMFATPAPQQQAAPAPAPAAQVDLSAVTTRVDELGKMVAGLTVELQKSSQVLAAVLEQNQKLLAASAHLYFTNASLAQMYQQGGFPQTVAGFNDYIKKFTVP